MQKFTSKLSLKSRAKSKETNLSNPGQKEKKALDTISNQKTISSYFTRPANKNAVTALGNSGSEALVANAETFKSPPKKDAEQVYDSPDFIPPTPESKRRKLEHKNSRKQLFIENVAQSDGSLIEEPCKKTEEKAVKHEEVKSETNSFTKIRTPVKQDPNTECVKKTSPLKSNLVLETDTFEMDDFDFDADFDMEALSVPDQNKDPYNLGRHVVLQYENHKSEVRLIIRPESNANEKKICILKDFWMHTAVQTGDIVHIHADWSFQDNNGSCMRTAVIDNKKGLIVVRPDVLVSGTSVVASIFCPRKAVLAERFGRTEAPNKQMLTGTIVHRLLQTVLKEESYSAESIEKILKTLMDDPSTLHGIYAGNFSSQELMSDIGRFVPMVSYVVDKYVLGKKVPLPKLSPKKFSQTSHWNGKIEKVRDIEENIWSPRFGIKGKIDLTVEVKIPSNSRTTKILPLELKTGRSTSSAEHRGQLNLYSMMMSGRGNSEPVDSGLLLYLRNGSLQDVPAGPKEQQQLLQLRNSMVHYMTKATARDEAGNPVEEPLPEPMDSERFCSMCPFLPECSIYYNASKAVHNPLSTETAAVFSSATSHLEPEHVKYFLRWSLLLRLEWEEDVSRKRGLSEIWCTEPSVRQERGTCICHLQVQECQATQFHTSEMDQFIIQLHKVSGDPLPRSTSLQPGDGVVVSSDREVALATGCVIEISSSSIAIATDRNLKQGDYSQTVVHVDKLDYQGGQSLLYSNLSRLIANNDRAAHLRSLIVDLKPPRFKPGLPREVSVAAKPILQQLNKLQQRAVLKALTCEDYCLINGLPGTGKTSLIIALIRLAVTLGQSVLLTSYTHTAVDNVLLKLKETEVDFIRIGRSYRTHSDLREYTEEFRSRKCSSVSQVEEMYGSVSVVAATALSMRHAVFQRRKFDLCIVDEAAQALQLAVIGPLTVAKRFVLVGDPLQLPPVVQSPKAKSLGMSESLFARLQGAAATATMPLQLQYRMNRGINALANKLSYQGQLQCGTAEVEHAVLSFDKPGSLLDKPQWIQDVLSGDLTDSVKFLDTSLLPEKLKNSSSISPSNSSPMNSLEASASLLLIEALLEAGIRSEDVGVMAPYQSQVKLLKKLTNQIDRKLEINTVDQYQGRDKKVVIYSCTKSAPNLNGEAVSILHDEKRLTVAVTRAKLKLIIIGDSSSLKNFPPFFKLIQSLSGNQIYSLCNGVDGFYAEKILAASNL